MESSKSRTVGHRFDRTEYAVRLFRRKSRDGYVLRRQVNRKQQNPDRKQKVASAKRPDARFEMPGEERFNRFAQLRIRLVKRCRLLRQLKVLFVMHKPAIIQPMDFSKTLHPCIAPARQLRMTALGIGEIPSRMMPACDCRQTQLSCHRRMHRKTITHPKLPWFNLNNQFAPRHHIAVRLNRIAHRCFRHAHPAPPLCAADSNLLYPPARPSGCSLPASDACRSIHAAA